MAIGTMIQKAVGVCCIVALAAGTAGCGGSGGDKAGGQGAKNPVVLTLAKHDVNYAFAEFASAVETLSGGSIRIDVLPDWRDGEVDYERGTVEDVRDAKVELGVVGVRVLDTMGVTSFRAVVAPFLVDSLGLQRRVLERLPEGVLESVEQAGVVGISVLPGPLRRPVGFSRRLVDPQDYRGATIGIRPSGVAEATFRALGARAKSYLPGDVAGLDAAELDFATIAQNNYDKLARSFLGNVVLWPRVELIVMNRDTFEALTSEQQEILRRAGRDVLGAELARLEREERAGLVAVCERGARSLVTASVADLRSLREAVQPVYDELERDPQTRDWIAEIAELREEGQVAASALNCPEKDASPKSYASKLEGRWTVNWTLEELLAAGTHRGLPRSFAVGTSSSSRQDVSGRREVGPTGRTLSTAT
jgi:TRAP-type C4-dicarboxylate transport system substrate-binding protein